MPPQESLFQRLTKLFRSGPSIKRKVRQVSKADSNASSAIDVFRKAASNTYNSTINAYGSFDRMARYSDFSEMEATPEIASALDIYAEETVSPDVYGNVLHIHSDNRKIKELLDTLFFDTLNIDFNLAMWVRHLCKYGDFFLFNEVHPEFGIINTYPISITEMEREEGFDPEDPSAVRFRWITQGNTMLENWQVSHFRLLGNDSFLPYGSSVLESARRIWRQLILIEDAMLVYRVIRSPERRVFYIDVGNVPPEDVPNYLEQAKTALKRNSVINKNTGHVDLRYNPLSVDEDYFLPVRGGDSGTRIENLPGGTNTSAIEDVEYIQKKLFAALKIPKAYLGYDEDIGAKATLAQEDIRFSRTISRIQKTIIAELNKLAMIHLYAHGFDSEDLLDFNLKLSNPSSIAQQQQLELVRARFEISAAAPENLVSRGWILKNVMGFNRDDILKINEEKMDEKLKDLELEAAKAPGGEEAAEGGGDEGGGGGGGGLFAGDMIDGALLSANDLISPVYGDQLLEDDEEELELEDEIDLEKIAGDISSITPTPKTKHKINKSRKVRNGPASTHMPDLHKMASVGRSARPQDTSNRPYDNDFFKNPFGEGKIADFIFSSIDEEPRPQKRLGHESKKMLQKMGEKIGINKRLVLEGINLDIINEGGDIDD